jgi:hypothetical protein
VLSLTQYGFREGKGTKDCLAILTKDINYSFEKEEQTVANLHSKTYQRPMIMSLLTLYVRSWLNES